MQDATFSLAITPSLPVPLPQLHVQIEEYNAFEDFSCYLEGCYSYMWQSHVEIEGYSVVYFDCIPAPYR